jgi:hypothetical protein
MNYSNIYTKIIEHRRNNAPTGYYETHHILPRCLGGANSKDNLVKLTAKEHFICHLLLTKMHSAGVAHYKMCKAFLMMAAMNEQQPRHIAAKQYDAIKRNGAAYMSIVQAGENNSQFGTKWIYNKELALSKKVQKDFILPAGWECGKFSTSKLSVAGVCKYCGTNFTVDRKTKWMCNACKKERRRATGKLDCMKKQCSINGNIFQSVREAADALGIKQNTLQFRINSKNFKEYFYTSDSK